MSQPWEVEHAGEGDLLADYLEIISELTEAEARDMCTDEGIALPNGTVDADSSSEVMLHLLRGSLSQHFTEQLTTEPFDAELHSDAFRSDTGFDIQYIIRGSDGETEVRRTSLASDVPQLVVDSIITDETLVWYEGAGDWWPFRYTAVTGFYG